MIVPTMLVMITQLGVVDGDDRLMSGKAVANV
jgi:hypothetical protein